MITRHFVRNLDNRPAVSAKNTLDRFGGKIAFAADNETARRCVAEILAADQLIAIDFETVPISSERERLQCIRRQLAEIEGRIKALAKLKATERLATAKAERATLKKAEEHAERAAFDPHRSRVRLVQLYAGGSSVAVFDMARVAWSVLDPVWERPIVAHNASFELSHLAIHSIEPLDMHCTLQAVRLLCGPDATALATAAATYFGLDLPKDLQTSDWSAEHLTLPQLNYAALDAVVTWHLAETVLPLLAERTPAYEIQMGAIPAVVRMQLRGIRLDTSAHSTLVSALEAHRAKRVAAYGAACDAAGRPDLRQAGVPGSPNAIEKLLETLLTEQERDGWPRTEKAGRLRARRADLAAVADAYPLLRALIDIGIIDKQLSTFGTGLAAQVSPVTGRIHAIYKIMGAVSGRTSCNRPNLQQVPDQQRIDGLPSFRTLFVAKPGYTLVAADWASMEMRAAAHISGDTTMTQAFEQGEDLHVLTARTMLGLDADGWQALPEEERTLHRKHAKPVNFGRLYGQGARGLVQAARDNYGIVLDLATAEEWIRAFQETYSDYPAWCRRFARECERTREIPIGRAGGRIHEIHWNLEGFRYTQCLNLPIQGACADASMLALAAIDRMLFEASIEGGPVAWLHDEIVLEVPAEDAEKAAELLRTTMVEAFAETFPGAPLNWLVAVKIGSSWAEAKS